MWVKKSPWGFLTFFPKRLGLFSPNFTRLLYVPIYARVRIFIQLSATLMKLCHIKCDHRVHIMCSKCTPSAETHAFRRLRKSLIALLIVVCGKSSQMCCSALFSSFRDGLWLWLKFVKCLTHCTPHMVVEGVEVWWVWWPLVLCDEVGAIHLQSFLRLAGKLQTLL